MTLVGLAGGPVQPVAGAADAWFAPRASVLELTRRLESAPEGAFYCCEDRVQTDVFHVVYRCARGVWVPPRPPRATSKASSLRT